MSLAQSEGSEEGLVEISILVCDSKALLIVLDVINDSGGMYSDYAIKLMSLSPITSYLGIAQLHNSRYGIT